MRALVLVLLLPVVCRAGPKPGDEGTPESQKAAELVRRLGDPKFAVREAAAKQLLDMGGAAVPALAAGAKSADEEVRTRSAALLPRARAVGWGRRADAFLADPTGTHDLPLRTEWEKLAGEPDAGSRALFAGMVRASGPLLELAATDRRAAVAALHARSTELLDGARTRGKQVDAPATEIAALLFVQTVLKDPPPPRASATRHEPLYLVANPAVGTALGDEDAGPAFRRLVAGWIESRPADEAMSALYFALLAHRRPFPEADRPLIRLAGKHPSVHIRWVAMEALGRSRTEAATAQLTEWLADTSALHEDVGGPDARQQVRDGALAALINGAGKEPTAYGMTSYLLTTFWFGGEADAGVSLHLYGFKSAADRDRALKKWQAGSASKPKAGRD